VRGKTSRFGISPAIILSIINARGPSKAVTPMKPRV